MENSNKILPHSLPENYFNEFSGRVMSSIKAMESESDPVVQELASVDPPMPFSKVEPQYFSQLSDSIFSKIKAAEEADDYLQTLYRGQSVQEVPQGYFDHFADKLQARINTEDKDLVELDEVLSSIGKDMPYTVDQHYFEQFSFEIPQTSQTKVVDFQPKTSEKASTIETKFFKSMKWSSAIAASVALLILGWGGFVLLNNDDHVAGQQGALAVASTTESPSTPSAKLAYTVLEDVSTEALAEYFTDNLDSDDIYQVMDLYVNTKHDVTNVGQDILRDVSAEDIESFLEYEGML